MFTKNHVLHVRNVVFFLEKEVEYQEGRLFGSHLECQYFVFAIHFSCEELSPSALHLIV